MRYWQVGVAMLFAGCAYHNPAGGNTDAQSDGTTDSASDPCILDDINLDAATLSGCASAGTNDGVRGVAHFDNPVNLVLGPSGIAYVSDFDSSLIRKVDVDGKTTTIVSRPDLLRPFGMIMTPDGYLYVETDDDDQGVHSTESGTIWKVNPSTGAANVIIRDHERPRGLALLANGTLAMCDYVHHTVELLDPTTAIVTPLAGVLDVYGYNNATGTAQLFAQPWDLVLNTDGDLIVSEFQNNRLRRVTLAGVVTDFAGSGVQGHQDGPLATAQFFNPKGMTIDANGAIYVSEGGNHDIRKIANGMVTTLAGVPPTPGYADNDDPMQAMYYGVEGLDVSSDGTRLVIADGNNGDMSAFNHVRSLKQ